MPNNALEKDSNLEVGKHDCKFSIPCMIHDSKKKTVLKPDNEASQ